MNGRPTTHTAYALVVALAFGTVLAAAPAATAGHNPGPCRFHREDGQTVRQHARNQIRCAVGRWSVPGGVTTAVCIAKRESGLLPWAESSDGLNKGLFQQHVDYWDGNYASYTRKAWQLRHTILSGRTNAIVSIRMAHSIGWGPWGGRRCG
ncbi:MAG: hypothetical protein OEV60_11055 [Actinomycetota bacterium]|nr:hypothetical protein [Actinomycetota bacterium]MDH5224809.1 hypothetical protein [Actinomycetota bacterium]